MKVQKYPIARHKTKAERTARRYAEYLARRKRRIIIAWTAIAAGIAVILDLLILALCFIDKNNGANAAKAIPIFNILIIPLAIIIGREIAEKL